MAARLSQCLGGRGWCPLPRRRLHLLWLSHARWQWAWIGGKRWIVWCVGADRKDLPRLWLNYFMEAWKAVWLDSARTPGGHHTFAYISDKTNRRGGTVIAAQCCYLTALVITRQVHPHVDQWSRWALWTLVNSFAVGYHPVHNTWVQVNCQTPGERSVSIAYVPPQELFANACRRY